MSWTTAEMVYAILLFLWQLAWRRAANQTFANPTAREGFRAVFPEHDTIPHTDTVARLFEQMELTTSAANFSKTMRRLLRPHKLWHRMVARSVDHRS